MAKSAFTYQDFESNQLGTRFYFQYGIKVNNLPEDQRASAFESALNTFFWLFTGICGFVSEQI